jgi:hypothetical protein
VTKRITSFFALTTFVLAASGSAFAADIAVKAPLPAPSPVYNWTGWYAGVNAGASFGSVKTDFSVPVTVFTSAIGPPLALLKSRCWLGQRVPKRFHWWWSDRLQLAALPYLGRGA